MEQRNENKTELKMIKMSDVPRQWTGSGIPFIPYGKLTIIREIRVMEKLRWY